MAHLDYLDHRKLFCKNKLDFVMILVMLLKLKWQSLWYWCRHLQIHVFFCKIQKCLGLKAPYEKLCAEPIWWAIELSRIMDLPTGGSTTLNKVCGLWPPLEVLSFRKNENCDNCIWKIFQKNPCMTFQKCQNNVSM